MTFHINTQLFIGQKILKVKRDYYDPYVWVVGQNNTIYRINSLTLAVDDYTAAFLAYSSLRFIDIAGRSQDTVFIAANSPDVIEYYNGSLRDIGTARGLKDTVNSVGLADQYQYLPSQTLQIGTSHGLGKYFYVPDSLSYYTYQNYTIGPVKILTQTYRTEMITDDHNDTFPPEFFYPVMFATDGITAWAYDIRHISQSGIPINTAYYVPVGVVTPSLFGGSFFWANAFGLYQESMNINNLDPSDFNHFLNNININKITDILGLTSFYYASPSIAKDNLLLGTDSGFYFSSSLMAKFVPVDVAAVNLFHYAPLGNLKINDVCVNTTGTNFYSVPTGCENGVWLATDNGLYLLNPDYGAYLNGSTMADALYIDQPLADTLTNVNVCQGTSVTAQLNTNFINSNLIQWEKNGNDIIGATRDSLKIDSPGEYYAILYDPCGNVHIQTNRIKATIISSPVFTFNYPDTIQQCINTTDTLKASNTPGCHYQWYTNGVLNGDTTSSYIVTQSGKYKVEVSACAGSWISSKEIQVNFIIIPTPVITTDKSAYCIGDNATLSIAVPVDLGYTINWYKDNAPIPADANQNSITTNIAGNYTVSIVNNTINTDGTTCSQTSAGYSLAFNPPPTVNIEKIVNTTICEGQTINLLAHYNGGTVKWSTGETSDQISVTTPGNYTATVTSTAGCQADTNITIAFLSNPVFNVNDTSICTYKKQVVTLTAPSGFAQYAWNGTPGGQTYQVSSPQTVSLTVIDVNGCQASQQIVVADQCPNVFIPNTFTPNGDGINDTWVIEGLDNDATVLVRVFTRYGTQIYESKGYGTPWNGRYNDKKLPAGVYYYIINGKNGTQKLSGSLTIIY